MTVILVGSRAAKHHWPSFRNPVDVDVICSSTEAKEIITRLALVRVNRTNDRKWSGYTSVGPGALYIEMALPYGTHKEIYDICQTEPVAFSKELAMPCAVASQEMLFLLKRSHICFDVRWKKNFLDYQYMQSRNLSVPQKWHELLERRVQETATRVGFKNPNFDVTNEEFFERSERAVKRVFSHDFLHECMKLGERPAYLEAKIDATKAALSPEKFFSLPHETQIRILQEEMIVLALERTIIPALEKNQPYNARAALLDIARRLVVNFLPLWQRFFMVDNFNAVIDYKEDYVKEFLKHGE